MKQKSKLEPKKLSFLCTFKVHVFDKKSWKPKDSIVRFKDDAIKNNLSYMLESSCMFWEKFFTSIHIFIYIGWMKTNGRSPDT
jgi:hypothetical protein